MPAAVLLDAAALPARAGPAVRLLPGLARPHSCSFCREQLQDAVDCSRLTCPAQQRLLHFINQCNLLATSDKEPATLLEASMTMQDCTGSI